MAKKKGTKKKGTKEAEPKKGESKARKGEQLDLIEVHPKNVKAIVREARLYKELQATRLSALAKEVAQKEKVKEMVKAAGFQRLDDGTIRFEYDGVLVTVAPQDDKITVKDKEKDE